MPLGGLIIAGAGVAASAIEGGIQEHKANQIKPQDPHYVIPQQFYENREIARQMAQLGLPSAVTNNATNQINQSQAAGLVAAQNSSNPAGAISGVLGQTNKAKANLASQNAEAQQNNERFFINENGVLGGQQLAQQQSDVFDKFTRDFNQMQAYRGAGLQNFNQAIGGAQGLGETYLNYLGNQNKTANILPGATPDLQIPQQFWNSPGLTPPQVGNGFNPYNPANYAGFGKMPYDPSQNYNPLMGGSY